MGRISSLKVMQTNIHWNLSQQKHRSLFSPITEVSPQRSSASWSATFLCWMSSPKQNSLLGLGPGASSKDPLCHSRPIILNQQMYKNNCSIFTCGYFVLFQHRPFLSSLGHHWVSFGFKAALFFHHPSGGFTPRWERRRLRLSVKITSETSGLAETTHQWPVFQSV